MKMANNVKNIEKHTFKSEDKIFLDTNIWVSIYGPLAFINWNSNIYSGALREIRESGCDVYIDVLVLSEFINRFARVEYDQRDPDKKSRNFKTFRKSSDFEPIAEEIAVDVRNILKNSICCESGFSGLIIDDMMDIFKSGNSDFNDLMIAEICKKNGFILVTDDADFKGCDIPILTANRGLLS